MCNFELDIKLRDRSRSFRTKWLNLNTIDMYGVFLSLYFLR